MKKILLWCLFVSAVGFGVLQLDAQKMSNECAFCREEVLERQLIYQGRLAEALLTHKPAAPGHVLIVPVRHVERFEELTREEMAEMQEVIQKVDRAVKKLYGTSGYILLQKNGKEAGQSVPHVHFHYIPAVRFLAVRFFAAPWLKSLSGDQMKALKQNFSESI